MKKFACILAAVMCIGVALSFGACTNMENGIKIKYATVTLSFKDADDKDRTESVSIKLYVDYAPNTVARFEELAKSNFYNGTVVNNVETGWFSLGGFKAEDNKLTEVKSDKGNLEGEFLQGNRLAITKGTVLMYRNFSNLAAPNNTEGETVGSFDSGDCRFVICTGSAPFSTSTYAVFGMVVDEDLGKLDYITELQYRTSDDSSDSSDEDSSKTEYNYYYAGGIDKLAKTIHDDEILADRAAGNGITEEDYESVAEGGEHFHEPGFMSQDTYDDFIEVAQKFISTASSNASEYFFKVPYNTVTITSVKITSKV